MGRFKKEKLYKRDGRWYIYPGVLHHPFKPAVKNNNEEIWYDYGTMHRDDGPAHITKTEEIWYQHGLKHRVDGPAVIKKKANGKINFKGWFFENKLHRLDGPAVEDWSKGSRLFYQYGKRHRIGGPAEIERGYEAWYKDDKLHRIDGPAIPSEDRWHFHGKDVTKEFRQWCKDNFIDRFKLTEEDKFFIQMKWE